MKDDNAPDYADMLVGLLFATAWLIIGALWVVYRLARLLLRFAWWLSGGRWLVRRLLREFRDYWAWRSGPAWKLERYERQVAREWEYIRRDVPWDQLRPGFQPLGTRLLEWFQDRSFPVWLRSRRKAKSGKSPAERQSV